MVHGTGWSAEADKFFWLRVTYGGYFSDSAYTAAPQQFISITERGVLPWHRMLLNQTHYQRKSTIMLH